MTGRAVDAAPLRFLAAVMALWVTGRGAVLLGWQTPAALRPPIAGKAVAGMARGLVRAPIPAPIVASPSHPGRELRFAIMPAAARAPLLKGAGFHPIAPRNDIGLAAAERVPLAATAGPRPPIRHDATSLGEAVTAAGGATGVRHGRLSGSGWVFVRGGGRATPLSPSGQIGGGQTGLRVLYRLDGKGLVSASGRLSTTIGGIRQSEAAVGIDIRPIAALPVHLTAERRIAIDSGGRNAWTLGAAGGVYAVRLGGGWRLDAYGEAGIVGARRRDLYADGAARIARAIDLGGGTSLALGGGAWAAAQPRVSRFDVGPSAVLRVPVAGRTIALALDWREQVAGQARPRSGIAFTTAVDF